jgi:transcriptional regulator with XRE-family HTH domain
MVLGQKVRERRKAFGLSQEHLAHRAGVSLNAVHKLEAGRITDPHFSTLSGIARALDTTVAELVGEEMAVPLAEASETRPPQVSRVERDAALEDEQPTKEPQSAEPRTYVLEGILEHLTLRLETLRDQAKMYSEARDHDELWRVFMDSVLLAKGAESFLAEFGEQAEELGDETAEERRLRDRLKHRTKDAAETRAKIGNMWNEAGKVARRKEPHPEAESPDRANIEHIFSRRERAG